MPFAYILKTAKGTYYTGSTDNLQERLLAHRAGRVSSTRSKLPVTLVYAEKFSTRGEAQKKEYRIKKWKNKKLIGSLIRKANQSYQLAAPSSIG